MTATTFDIGTWATAVGEDSGQPVVLRVRTDRPRGAVPDEFRYRILAMWPYQSDNVVGMPTVADSSRMDEFEELLTTALQSVGQAVLTAVVTGTGMREWQWYAADPDEVARLVDAALMGQEPFPIEFSGDEDPNWNAHKQALTVLEQLQAAAAQALPLT